jgi:hypothetical protein
MGMAHCKYGCDCGCSICGILHLKRCWSPCEVGWLLGIGAVSVKREEKTGLLVCGYKRIPGGRDL